MDYEVINSAKPDSEYCNINECDMMTNFKQNIRTPTSDKDYEVKKSPKRPRSPNLMESCYREMEKKGLRFFDGYKNVEPVITKKTPPPQCRNLSSQSIFIYIYY